MSRVKYLLIAAVIVGAIAALVAWNQRTLVAALPPRIVCANQTDARAQAGGDSAFPILGTGSMAPYIPAAPAGKDPMTTIVAYAKRDSRGFADIKKGDLVSYSPKWAKGLVLHQAAEKTSSGWIMSGLHNPQSESWEPITEREFFALISAVYVW